MTKIAQKIYKNRYKVMNQCSQTAVAAMVVFPNFITVANATDLQSKITDIFSGIYGFIFSITSVTAGVAAAICLYLMLFSKSSKTVEESTAWLKRIALCWAGIALIGAIIAFGNSLFGTSGTLNTTATSNS